MMINGQDDLSDLSEILDKFKPQELEQIQDLLTDLNPTIPDVNGLRRLASQSLAHIATDEQQSSQLSEPDYQQILDPPSTTTVVPPDKDGTNSKNAVAQQNETLKKDDTDRVGNRKMPETPPVNNDNAESEPKPGPSTPTAPVALVAGGSQQPTRSRDDTAIPTRVRLCAVCGFDKDVFRYRRILTCCNCRAFFKRAIKERKSLQCLRGDNCPVTYQRKTRICSSCRLKKSIDLGLIITDWEDAKSPEHEPPIRIQEDGVVNSDEELELQAALEASLITYEEDQRVQDAKELSRRQSKRVAEELEACSLPANVFTYFSRWFYADMSNFTRGRNSPKNPQDEVKPEATSKVLVYSNDVSNHDLTLLTQDLDIEEPMPIQEILTPVMTIKPSAELLQAKGVVGQDGAEPALRAGAVVQKKAKPKLTFTLETLRTTIDRRPMLKRLKTFPCSTNLVQNDTSGAVTSTSLIAPGEDCDDSDDNEIIEIDCDTN